MRGVLKRLALTSLPSPTVETCSTELLTLTCNRACDLVWKSALCRRLFPSSPSRINTTGHRRIAQRLQMGTWTYVSNLLNEPSETQPQAQEVLALCQ